MMRALTPFPNRTELTALRAEIHATAARLRQVARSLEGEQAPHRAFTLRRPRLRLLPGGRRSR